MAEATYYIRAPGGAVYRPTPKQAEFHRSRARRLWVRGGVRSGKSLAACVEAMVTALEFPGSKGLVGRYTWRELATTTWAMMKEITPRPLIHQLRESPNGCWMDLYAGGGKLSRIWGVPLSNTSAIMSAEYDWFFIDEGGEIDSRDGPELWRRLGSRLSGAIGPRRGWVVSNPNGYDWLYDLFIRNERNGYESIHCPTSCNANNLAVGYIEEQRRNDPLWVARFIDAEFCQLTGLVLHSWDPGVHIVNRFRPPAHWPLFVSIDPGLMDPCCALLATCSPDGTVIVLDEVYETDLTIEQQVKHIQEMTAGRRIAWYVIDPSTVSREHVGGVSRLDLYRQRGLPVEPGRNRVADGIVALQQLLSFDPLAPHPLTGAPGAPGLLICANCSNTISEIPNWIWDERKGKPRDGGADHGIASLRYLALRKPHPAPRVPVNELRPDFVLEGVVLPPRTPIVVTPDMPPHVREIWRKRLGGGHGERQSLPLIGALPGGATVQ